MERKSYVQKYFDKGVKYAVIGVGALGNPKLRTKLYNNLCKIGFIIPTLIHPKAIIEPSAKLGEGCQIMAGAIVGSDAIVGDNCILNAGSIVSHDCILKDNVHLTPGSILAGSVTIGQNSIIGMGSSVYIGVTIGKNAVIMNGTSVVRDILDSEVLKSSKI